MRTSFRFATLALIPAALFGIAAVSPAYADNDNDNDKFKVDPGVFIGKTTGCIGSRIVGAEWVKDMGLPDAKGNGSEALILSKNGPTGDCSAAGATLKGVKGITLTELGYDVRNGSHCSGGAPRFNVVTNDNVLHFIGACTNATVTPNSPQPGWSRVRMDPSNPAHAFPPIIPGTKVVSIDITFDEGVDTGPDFSGMAVLDNIDVNGVLVGRK